MKLAFTNLLALITVSLVLVTIESQQASALEDGELYVKRNNAGHSVPAGPRGGSRAGGGAATGGAGNKRPATTAGTTGRNTKPLTQTPSAGAGGAGAGTGRGKGGAGGGGIAGGGGAGGGRRGGGGGGSQPKPKARMAKRQVKEESDHEKRDLNAEVILEKRFGGPPGLEWPPKAKRSTYDEQAQLEKRDPKNPNGMHPIKRDNSGNLVKRDPHGHSLPRRPRRMMKRKVGLEGKSFLVKRNHGMPSPHGMAGPPHGMGGHHGGGGMMKREVNLPANQYGLIKRSPEPHKGPHGGGGGGFKGRGPPRGMGMMKREVKLQTNQYDLIKRSPEPHKGPHGGGGFKGRGGPPGGMGMMKRSLGGKERFSSTGPRYSKRSNDQSS